MRQLQGKGLKWNRTWARLIAISALLTAISTGAWAQVRIVGAIAGTVSDADGGVVPNAKVQLKDEGTDIEKETTTNSSGVFLIPDLSFGSYQVTISTKGFQTAVFKGVLVESSRTTDLNVKLQVGAVEELVQVEGVAPTLVISSNLIATTIDNKAVQQLPVLNRTVTNLARLTPGASTPPPTADTHFNGLPGGAINPTFDGINNASNALKSGGTSFFMTARPRQGAVEEVAVETGGLEADAGAQGAVNLKFITRRGTNRYHGSVFEQVRNEAFNANSFSNNARNLPRVKSRQHDFGGNFGGPLLPFGKWQEKVFFFINFEVEYIPGTAVQTNQVLTSEAQQGVFRYQTATGEQRTANILQIAGANGFQSTIDPNIASMMSRQNQAFSVGRLINNDLRTQTFNWVEPSKRVNTYPTARVDYQITPNLAWMGSWNLYHQNDEGRRLWPIPNQPAQLRFRGSLWITSTGLNWTISPRTHNEFRYGVQHSGDAIPNSDPTIYDTNGKLNGSRFRLAPLPFSLQSMVQNEFPMTSRRYITTIYDTLTLQRGNHSMKVGGTMRTTDTHDTSYNGASGILTVPQYTIGIAAGDPVSSIFNATTMPGLQSSDQGNASSLYAYLTGRLTRIRSDRVVDTETFKYSDNAERHNWTASKMGGLYAQDSWRWKPTLTLNYGLRWEFTGDIHNVNGIAVFPDYANLLGPSTALFAPGVLNGVANPVMKPGKHAYGSDLVNPAPNIGFAWNPRFEQGWLGKLFGKDQKTVIRGGYAINYYDEGTNMFASNPGSNPGQTQTLDMRPGLPGFNPGGLTLQSTIPPFIAFPLEYKDAFNQADFTFASGFSTMDPNLRTPYVQQWNLSVQRQVMRNTVVEMRYVGNRSVHGWRTFNLNEVNIFENGFLQEFKNAQRNLQISQAAGVNNFANRGLPGQVPLPIFETAFGSRGSQAALPAGSGFTNGAFITNLQQGTAGALASSLAGNSIYLCRMLGNTFSPCGALGFNAPGPYPINFFQVNPFAAGQNLNFVDDNSNTSYHALQIQLRRQYSRGLSLTANYAYSKALTDTWVNNSTLNLNYYTLRKPGLDKGPSPYDLRHIFQTFFTYDLPFGAGRQFKVGNRILDTMFGGWTLGGILTAQSGSVFRLSSGRSTVNASDGGIILTGGMTQSELQKLIKINLGPGLNRYFLDPKLIGPDGRANPQYLQVPTEPGQFGEIVYLYGKNTYNFDASLVKDIRITERVSLNLWVGASNVLNHPIWSGPIFNNTQNIQSTTFAQSTGPANNARAMQVRGVLNF